MLTSESLSTLTLDGFRIVANQCRVCLLQDIVSRLRTIRASDVAWKVTDAGLSPEKRYDTIDAEGADRALYASERFSNAICIGTILTQSATNTYQSMSDLLL